MKGIKFSSKLTLPIDAVTQTFAFLAKRGAGKSYGASKLAEGMVEIGAQIVALDPVGNWWGLRLNASGKRQGIPIPVFGGLKGDIPIEPTAGALIADVIVDRGISAILDVSMFRKGERKRFAADFGEQLFQRKKEHRSPLHLFIEEAQTFCPQRMQPDEARMLGAFEDIVKLGRNFGIGATLISQRPQSVSKEVLSQTECLVVLQTNGAQERKAIREWVVEQGMDIVKLVDELPGLERGEAWVWSPSWLRKTVRVQIAEKWTFDASSTPKTGTKRQAIKPLTKSDLGTLRDSMKSVVEQAERDDPKVLKARITELVRELAYAKAKTTVVTKEVYVVKKSDLKKIDSLINRASRVSFLSAAAQQKLSEEIEKLSAKLSKVTGAEISGVYEKRSPLGAWKEVEKKPYKPPEVQSVASPPASKRRPQETPAAWVERTEKNGDIGNSLKKGARLMLVALRDLGGSVGLTRDQIAAQVGLPARGTTFQSYLSTLKRGGYVEEIMLVRLTAKGVAFIGPPQAPKSTEEMLSLWEPKLKAGARNMLRETVKAYPNALTREWLGHQVSLPANGTTFQSYLSTLVRAGLVEKAGSGSGINTGVRASATLFPQRVA